MPRFRDEDLAYGDIPQRWDRERFERFGTRGPPTHYEDDYRFAERDRPGRRDVALAEHREASRPGRRWEETDRFWEEDRARSRPRRRTDRELFGDIDPREVAEMALTPYNRKGLSREELDMPHREPPRPGLLRRQSSLDTFDRRPSRPYERDEYRIAPYTPVPLPIRRRHDDWDDYHYRYRDGPDDYHEVEIQRERSVHRRRPPKSERSAKESKKSSSSSSSSSFEESEEEEESEKATTKAPSRAPSKAKSSKAKSSKAPSTKAKSSKAPSAKAPSVYSSVHDTVIEEEEVIPSVPLPPPAKSVYESIHETAFEESVREERRFKKGKTRMPKRLVRREAIMDLGYPFDEEEDFFVLRIALEKEQIDEVIQISEQYKDGGEFYSTCKEPSTFANFTPEKRKVYRFDESVHEGSPVPPPPVGEHEEIQRTEWINPPTVAGSHSRARSPNAKSSISQRSPARTSRSRAPSSPGTFVEERKTVIEETRSPPPPPSAYRAPSAPPPPANPEFYEEHKTVIEERSPHHHHHHHPGTVVLAEREHRSDRDINAEIRALESERRALRLEREAEERNDLALRLRERPHEEYHQLVEYRDRSRPRDELVVYERERSPPRNVIRVEKDRKGRMALVRSAH